MASAVLPMRRNRISAAGIGVEAPRSIFATRGIGRENHADDHDRLAVAFECHLVFCIISGNKFFTPKRRPRIT